MKTISEPSTYSLSSSSRAPVPQFHRPVSRTPKIVILDDSDVHHQQVSPYLIFELSGVSVAFANAMRRIMLGEVETMAIEVVKVYRNDSVMQDEVLSHRLGLIPIRVDHMNKIEPWTRQGELTANNCVAFMLDMVAGNETQRDQTVHLTAKELKPISWETAMKMEMNEGDVSKLGPAIDVSMDATVLHPDIVLTKLKPREGIRLLAYATKGIGMEHAKWSPVSTASYKMKPHVEITHAIKGEAAKQVKSRCPMNVFDIEDHHLVVARESQCTMCRECIREGAGMGNIELTRYADCFIFKVETTEQLSCRDIVKRTLEILKTKAEKIMNELPDDGDEQVVDDM